MAVLKEILGWKWNNLEELDIAEATCQKIFQLPRKAIGQVTTKCIGAIPNYNTQGDIDFWYIGYIDSGQWKDALGEPNYFDITYIDSEDELQK